MDTITSDAIEQAVINALNRGAVDRKYVDIGRIPFICDDIRAIKVMLEEHTTTVQWTVKMIYLAIGGLAVITILVLPFLWAVIQAGKI